LLLLRRRSGQEPESSKAGEDAGEQSWAQQEQRYRHPTWEPQSSAPQSSRRHLASAEAAEAARASSLRAQASQRRRRRRWV
jgi:hypothetical protein